ncbi:MAG: ABC transporter permease [Anaerolineae bacterium]|nr:ABC transporter permease [Anaerolineae bacterium]
MADAGGAKPVRLAGEAAQSRSLFQDSLRRLVRHKAAMAGIVVIATLLFLALTADLLVRLGLLDHYSRQHRGSSLAPPLSCSVDLDKNDDDVPDPVQFCFLFGADRLGRDLLSRTIYGTRISLLVGVVGSSVSLLIGMVYGVVSGYYGGQVDNIMMRFVDFLYGLPTLPLIIIMQVYFRGLREQAAQIGGLGETMAEIDRAMGGLFFLFIALGMLSWIGMARLARGQVLQYKHMEFVEAARAVGAGDSRIIFIHLLPNIMGPLIVSEAMAIPGYIFTESFLSFLGLGVNPPMPSWGALITDAINEGAIRFRTYMLLIPGAALSITTLAFNFLGDGLRDALDPRMTGE